MQRQKPEVEKDLVFTEKKQVREMLNKGIEPEQNLFDSKSFEKEMAYYTELSQAGDLKELIKKIDGCIKRMGFSHYAFVRMDSVWESDGLKQLTTVSHELMNSYFENGFYEHDMSINYLAKNTKSIYRSIFDNYVGQASFEIDLFKTMLEIRRLNHLYGYFDHYHSIAKATDGSGNVVLVVTQKRLSPSDLRHKVNGHEISLQLLCEAIDFVITQRFAHCLGGPAEEKVVKISAKPLNVLSEFANGDLNLGQLADKLCISYVTANKHLEAVRKALGVKTNHAAIKKAIKQGLIQYK